MRVLAFLTLLHLLLLSLSNAQLRGYQGGVPNSQETGGLRNGASSQENQYTTQTQYHGSTFQPESDLRQLTRKESDTYNITSNGQRNRYPVYSSVVSQQHHVERHQEQSVNRQLNVRSSFSQGQSIGTQQQQPSPDIWYKHDNLQYQFHRHQPEQKMLQHNLAEKQQRKLGTDLKSRTYVADRLPVNQNRHRYNGHETYGTKDNRATKVDTNEITDRKTETKQLVKDTLVHDRRVEQIKQLLTAQQQVGNFPQKAAQDRLTQEINPMMTEREIIPIERELVTTNAPTIPPTPVPTIPPTPAPSPKPTTKEPTMIPTTTKPTASPTTLSPTTAQPRTLPPTPEPTKGAFLPSGANAYGNDSADTGPWKECIGWEGHDCKMYILSVTTDNPKIFIQDPAATDFQVHRVRVYTSIDGLVVRRPERG